MQTYQIEFSQPVNIADIEAALSLVGEFKLTAKRQKEPKAEREYMQPINAWRDGAIVREIDGLDVEKFVRKLDSERAARMRNDGRTKKDFPQYAQTAAEYISGFCNGQHHISVTYQYSEPNQSETIE